MGQYYQTPPTLLDGQQIGPRVDASGALVVASGSALTTLGTRLVVVKGTIPNTAASYASGQSVGGLITIATGLGANVVVRSVALHLRALAADVTTAGALAATWFDANPSASTITDTQAVAIPKADVPKVIAPVSVAALTAVAGAPTLVSTSSPPMMTTDASGNVYFALSAAASFVMATSSSIFYSFETTA